MCVKVQQERTDDSQLLAVRRREDVVEERGFARAEEAGEHRHWHLVGGVLDDDVLHFRE